MTIATSTDWTVTRDDIITHAYRKIGHLAEDASPSSSQLTHGALLLNGIVKSWASALNMPLWSLKIGYILPVSGTSQILFGTGGGHATLSYVSPTLTSDAASSATSIVVSSITGTANGYYIGIELDNGDIHWTTVSGSPSGSTINITTGLASAASSGNRVYCYQTKLLRPLRITKAFSRVVSSDADTPMEVFTSGEYLDLTVKSQESYPLKLYYDPQVDPSGAYVWPRFSDGSRIVVIQFVRPLGDFDGATDNPDFPQEWNLPLIYELACTLATDYGLTGEQYGMLRKQADMWIDRVSQGDYEEGSVYFAPATQR